MKILIIRFSAIGDIFHTFTVARDLREKYPNATIDWLVEEKFIGAAKMCADVDNFIAIPFKKWKKNPLTLIPNILKFKKQLQQQGNTYDFILEMHGLFKQAIFSKLLFNGVVYGLDKKSAKDGVVASIFYNQKHGVSRDNVAIVRFRELVAQAVGTDNNVPHSVNLFLPENKSNLENYVVALHGTSRDAKKLNLQQWCEIIKYVLSESDRKVVITYVSADEKKFCEELKSEIKNERLVVLESMSFNDFAAVIGGADLVIGVDTGFTHLANLLNKKTIGIYNNSNPNYGGVCESEIAKNIDFRNRDVDTAEVNQQVLKLINL